MFIWPNRSRHYPIRLAMPALPVKVLLVPMLNILPLVHQRRYQLCYYSHTLTASNGLR